tara:strand:+ start:64 stop:801 length:738 start_codon:yes stop_codon:yes gene_type:complete
MKESVKNILRFSFFGAYENLRDRKCLKQRLKEQNQIISEYTKTNTIKRLQIGCGSNIYEGWLNTDLNNTKNIAFLDAGSQFPIESDSFDYIYSEHLFEHLTISQQLNLLREGARILKKGGVMRIATPSLDFLSNLYTDTNSMTNQDYVKWAISASPYLKNVKEDVKDDSTHYCYVINNFFKAWGHQMIHNYSSIEKLSLQCGYSKVIPCEVGESQIPDLKNIERHGSIIPPKMNLIETMVVELIK